MQVAESGTLSDPQIYEQQVRRMLKEDLATKTLVEDFAAQWLNLRRLDEVNINTVLFPQYDVSLIEAFEKETEMFVAESIKTVQVSSSYLIQTTPTLTSAWPDTTRLKTYMAAAFERQLQIQINAADC